MTDKSVEITEIKTTKKGRSALFSVDGFLFSVDPAIIAAEHIEPGTVLSASELRDLKARSDIQKAEDKAFSILSVRMNSKKELRRKLLSKYDEYTVDAVIERLDELGYLDDEEYAETVIRQVAVPRHMSRAAARAYLAGRGIDREISDAAIEMLPEDETESIMEILSRKYTAEELSDPAKRRKISASLYRKGFRPSDIRRAIGEALGEDYFES
ncbi:MAG: regulatory protein RecX [Oscillospiraceae bacterium]|jgi:regulatory protein